MAGRETDPLRARGNATTAAAAGPASIIPDPGPPPANPNAGGGSLNGQPFTISADTRIYIASLDRVFSGWDETITNNGIVWLHNNDPHAWFFTGNRPQIFNNGMIYLHGTHQVELSPKGDHLVNTGSIYSISDSGWARVISSDVFAVFVDNSGLIAAQALGIDDTPDIEYSESWNATAIDAFGFAEIVNRAGGRILAEAPMLAICVSTAGSDWNQVNPTVTNAGLIEANATGPDGTAIGIYIAQPGYVPARIVNSGTIRADIAIYATYQQDSVRNPIEHVENRAGGVIDGLVILDLGDDTFVNDGSVLGDVLMGAGADTFSGVGSVSGVVDMGFDADSYAGSGGVDRAAGGRGDDLLRGNGGNDLLLGGFDNDTLRGDAGNDGLFGEWGGDTIETLGGDYVEGGDGDDRVVLGDYSFAGVFGEGGTDTLVLATGARNFSLSQMTGGGRIAGFEVIELKAGQQLALNANSIAAVTGGVPTLRVDAAAGNTIHLAGSWTRGADTTVGGTLYEAWTQGTAKVLVTEAATVTPGSTPAFGGLDPVASGAAAPHPGAASGLDYTDPAAFVSRFLLFGDFTVGEDEIFYSDGAPAFVAGDINNTGGPYPVFTNNGEIYSLDDAFPSAWGLDLPGHFSLINNGLIYVEEAAPLGSVYYYSSIAVSLSAGDERLENYGEISVYSVPGSAIAVHSVGELRNEGLIAAISENSRAIAVNNAYGTDIVDGSRSFFNTGLVYAEAGGVGRPVIIEGDAIVPEEFAATGVAAYGTVTNDGNIVAVLGPNADPDIITVGVYVLRHFTGVAGSDVINNGTIEGTIAIKFEDNANGTSHRVINNGLLIGDVEFVSKVNMNFHDEYDGSGGEIRGTVFGFGGDDKLTGGQFADSFEGGAGNDRLDGRGGTDTASYTLATSYVTVDLSLTVAQDTHGAGTDILLNIENLIGSASNDTLIGNDRANILDGRAGVDSLRGGLGNDTYYVDNAGDVIVEAVGAGTDIVLSSTSHTLKANVERLTLTGTANSSGAGNDLANMLFGNDGANVLDGKAGADGMVGGLGNDTYYVDNSGDLVTEEAGAGIDSVLSSVSHTLRANVERLTLTGTANISGAGNELANLLTGNAGNNALNGNAGADGMAGGLGNDTYYVDNVGDVVTEVAAAGTDIVLSSISYTLKANVERLTLTGTSNTSGTGNELANMVVGNAGNNVLDGKAGADGLMGGLGNDTYYVDNAGDLVTEAAGAGTDRVLSSVSHTLRANVEQLTMTGSANISGAGNELANLLTGNAGNNALNGNAGADVMVGGLGNDTYYVDNVGDVVTEAAGAGTDIVLSSIGYTLGTNVERLTLTGTGNTNGTGNELANMLVGNSGNNVLVGGLGADGLNGNGGNDTYRYTAAAESTAVSRDIIGQFDAGDRIDLSAIDANGAGAGDGAFTFVGASAFSGVAGELRATQVNGQWTIQGDINGDGLADLVIAVTTTYTFTSADFML